jgi:hypothetical protein
MMEMVNLFKLLYVGCTLHSSGFLAPLYILLVGFVYSGDWAGMDQRKVVQHAATLCSALQTEAC